MKRTRGFTLIEMAVVLLIIGILAGIVLRNVGSQGVVARDSKRVADLNIMHNYLVQYLQAQGVFPTIAVDTLAELQTELAAKGITDKLPTDPGSNSYNYYPCTDSATYAATNVPSHYVLQTTLEQSNTKAPNLYKERMTAYPTGITCWAAAASKAFAGTCDGANQVCSFQ